MRRAASSTPRSFSTGDQDRRPELGQFFCLSVLSVFFLFFFFLGGGTIVPVVGFFLPCSTVLAVVNCLEPSSTLGPLGSVIYCLFTAPGPAVPSPCAKLEVALGRATCQCHAHWVWGFSVVSIAYLSSSSPFLYLGPPLFKLSFSVQVFFSLRIWGKGAMQINLFSSFPFRGSTSGRRAFLATGRGRTRRMEGLRRTCLQGLIEYETPR